MKKTRYTAGSVFLLVIGTIICLLVSGFFTATAFKYPLQIEPGYVSLCGFISLYIPILTLPIFLIVFIESKIGFVAMWTITFLFAALSALGGVFG
jgi:hypothetical protein